MTKVYSAGIILYRQRENTNINEFFVCSPGGPEWKDKFSWNFPKGLVDNNEDPLETAYREFKEETSIELDKDFPIEFIGLIKQNPSKSVYVYKRKYNGEDLSNCYSNTFTWIDGKDYPEVDKYKWMTAEEIIKNKGIKAYYNIYKELT